MTTGSFSEGSVRAGTAPPAWTRADAAVLATVVGISAALVWPELFRGWYPWDDGAMAQVAERVMHGQLPHRDFDEPWTGGWSFVQAAIFRVAGTSLRMLRIPIFVVWLVSLACGFRLARRFSTPAVAGVATLAWGVWSLYAWHYPLLNWYYAPLALFAAWAVTRFVESGRRRYVVLAGVMVGIAIVEYAHQAVSAQAPQHGRERSLVEWRLQHAVDKRVFERAVGETAKGHRRMRDERIPALTCGGGVHAFEESHGAGFTQSKASGA